MSLTPLFIYSRSIKPHVPQLRLQQSHTLHIPASSKVSPSFERSSARVTEYFIIIVCGKIEKKEEEEENFTGAADTVM